MIFADVMVRFSTIDVVVHDKLPCGAAGLKVQFRFLDSAWNDLKKIAVFRNKSQIFDVAIVDNCATIPQELLTKVLDMIEVGVYGTNADQVLAIPTLWGSLGRIESAANPSGDAAMDPTLPYWALIQEQVDMLENTILGNDDPESVRVSALRTSGGEMSGDIEMCGNTITGLGTPTNDTDAATKGYVQSAAAPAGYGLGGNAPVTTAKLADLNKTGWYRYVHSASDNPVPGYGGHVHVVTSDIMTVQTAYVHGSYNAVLRRTTKSDGTFTDWEWENPPMELGVEYRTTERCEGKPVYAKRINCLSAPASVSISDLNIEKVVRWSGFVTYYGVALPCSIASWKVDINRTTISTTSAYEQASAHFYIDLYYTKT